MNNILILTARGPGFGTGHYYRMKTLQTYLADKGLSCSIIESLSIDPDSEKNKFINDLEPSLIIRDMRDSDSNTIETLQKYCPVITVDDVGGGSEISNLNIEILPNLKPDYKFASLEHFIYGYNFYKFMVNSEINIIEKDIDLFFYCPDSYPESYLRMIKHALPENKELFIFKKGKVYQNNIDTVVSDLSYNKLLLRSKVLISHYGILQFEAMLCGCSVLSMNPTEYHSSLSDLMTGKSNYHNGGIWNDADSASISGSLNILLNKKYEAVNISKIRSEITENLDRFYSLIESYL